MTKQFFWRGRWGELAISKARKRELVEQYRELIKQSHGMILTSYSGLAVKDIQELRGRIREAGGELHVVKNNLISLALKAADIALPAEALTGTTAIGFAGEDVPAVAKAIVELGRQFDFVRVKAGVVDGISYGPRQVERLADLPPQPVVQAQLLGVLQAPGGKLAGVLAGSVRQILNVIKAYSDKEAAAAA
jgi:large subunit ribosomal protein L10